MVAPLIRGVAGEGGLGPVRMIEVEAISAVGNLQFETLHPGEVHTTVSSAIPGFHNAAAPKLLAVAYHDKLNAGYLPLDLVIDADLRGKIIGASIQLDFHRTCGMGADTARVITSRNPEWLAINGRIFAGRSPALGDFGNIQFVEPNGGTVMDHRGRIGGIHRLDNRVVRE
jgi:hypothetical protein